MTNEQQQSPIFRQDKLKKHLYNTIWGIKQLLMNTRDCRRFEKDGKEKSDFRATKKGGKKGNPVNHNFAQLTKKIEKLEKALKKSIKKGKKRRYKDSNSDSE